MNDLTVSIITAIITGCITILGVVLSNNTKQAVIETKLEDLTEKVNKHNNFIERVYTLETEVAVLKERIDNE